MDFLNMIPDAKVDENEEEMSRIKDQESDGESSEDSDNNSSSGSQESSDSNEALNTEEQLPDEVKAPAEFMELFTTMNHYSKLILGDMLEAQTDFMLESDWECSEFAMLDEYDEICFEDTEIEEFGGTVEEFIHKLRQEPEQQNNNPVTKKRSRTRTNEN